MIKLHIAHKEFVKHLETESKSQSTLAAYGKDIEQLTEFLGNQGLNLVSEIELIHLERFMESKADENYTAKSISRKTNSTKTFFKFLKDKAFIKDDVSALLKHPRLKQNAPRILSKMEYRALRDAARNDVRTFAMVEVLLQTGITISELSEVQIDHIKMDDTKGNMFVPGKNNKDSRNIPLNSAVVEAISIYIKKERPSVESSKHLFITKSGNSLLIRNIRSTIDKHFKLAGVENATVNDLRHTFVAHHIKQGTNLMHLSKIAGHKRLSTTERYLQFVEIEAKEEKTELGIL